MLLHPEYQQKEIGYFPLGLGYIASACRAAEIDVICHDLNVSPLALGALVEAVKNSRCAVVGISGFLMQLQEAMRLATGIKQHLSDVVVMLGGVMTFGCEEYILRNSLTDVVFLGEAEEVLPNIVKSVANGDGYEQYKEIAYIKNGEFITGHHYATINDLDALKLPAYELFPMEQYIKNNYHSTPGKRTIDMICSRGCPYHCEYCINSKRENKVRYRSTDVIVSEIQFLKHKYNVTDFHFCDENFTTNKKRGLEICATLTPLGISWVTSCRADSLDDELIVAMKGAGCRCLLIGFESASDTILRAMNKKATTAVYSDAIALLRKNAMPFQANFMIGMPDETPETIAETVRFCIVNSLIYGPSYVTPFPGTKLYDTILFSIHDQASYMKGLASLNFSKRPYINLTKMPTSALMKHRDNAVISVVASMLKRKFPYIPQFIILAACVTYLRLAEIENHSVAKITKYIIGRLRVLLSGNS